MSDGWKHTEWSREGHVEEGIVGKKAEVAIHHIFTCNYDYDDDNDEGVTRQR